VGLKFQSGIASPRDNQSGAFAAVARGLTAQGYTATVNTMIWRVQASKADCRLAVRLIDAQSVNLDSFRALVGRTGQVRYLWQGEWVEHPPRFTPLIDYLVRREIVRLGWPASRSALWVVGASRTCETLPPNFAPSQIALLHGS
jgi:hypothetical protein